MKKILLSSVALVGLTFGAMAADLPMRAAPPPPVAVPIFTWTGFYAGVNIGYGFGDDEFDGGRLRTSNGVGGTLPVTPFTGGTFGRSSSEDGGILGGGQVGYNIQFGQFVAGIEADFQGIDLGDGSGFGGDTGRAVVVSGPGINGGRFGVGPGLGGGVNNVAFFDRRAQMDWFGTVRGRLGFAFDRAMIYATGGLAYTSFDDEDRLVPAAAFFVSPAIANRANRIARAAEEDRDDIGWTVGGGVEYAFTNNLSAKIEGLYVKIGDEENGNRVVGVTNRGRAIRHFGGTNNDGEFALVRGGINFRFNSF